MVWQWLPYGYSKDTVSAMFAPGWHSPRKAGGNVRK